MKRLSKLNLAFAFAAFVMALLGTILFFREPTEQLTRESLEAARKRWLDAGIRAYQLEYEMHGSVYAVTANRDGTIEVLVDGLAPTRGNVTSFVVEGVFDTLEMELDNLENPRGPFAGRRETILMRVRFHPQYGVVERYLRSSGGFGKGASIALIEFNADPAGE